MNRWKLALVAGGAALISGLAIAPQTAQAIGIFEPCSSDTDPTYDVSDLVDGATACTWRVDATQDSVGGPPGSTITVNEPNGFFGYEDWTFGGKIGTNASDGYEGDGTLQSGDFDLTSIADTVLSGKIVMAVFKTGNVSGTPDPNDGRDPVGLIGYLLGASSGDWDTPFTPEAISAVYGPDVDASNPKDVSHVSIYYRDGADTCRDGSPGPFCDDLTQVPVPAGLPLILTAFGAVGILARRQRKRSA